MSTTEDEVIRVRKPPRQAAPEPDTEENVVEFEPEGRVSKEELAQAQIAEDLGITSMIDPLQALLEAPRELPSDNIKIKRLKTSFLVRGVTDKEYANIQELSTRRVRNKRTGREEKDLDPQIMSRLLIVDGSVSPDWHDKALQKRFGQVSPHQMVQNALLPGEIEILSSRILELSGFNDDLEDVGKG